MSLWIKRLLILLFHGLGSHASILTKRVAQDSEACLDAWHGLQDDV